MIRLLVIAFAILAVAVAVICAVCIGYALRAEWRRYRDTGRWL